MAAKVHCGRDELVKKLEELQIETKTVDHVEVFTVEELLKEVKDVQGFHCKNLFMRDKKKKGLWLLSARHDADVKLNDLAKQVSAPGGLRLADESVLEDVLGVKRGCVTAFALINDTEKKVKFLIDEELLKDENTSLNFHPLSNAATTTITAKDLLKFVGTTGHEPTSVKFDSIESKPEQSA